MTDQERDLAQRNNSEGLFQSLRDGQGERHADLPNRTNASTLAGLARSAGNVAITELLENGDQGTPLDPSFREQMERALGTDLSGVRLRSDSKAQMSSASVNAEAFTSGEDIVLGAKAPAPDERAGEHLLAHELVHVLQQRRAEVVTGETGNPNDALEQEASHVSQQALQGQTVSVNAGGAVPGVQRQVAQTEKQVQATGASRKEVEHAVFEFLERARAAQGGSDLRLTHQVRDGLRMLVSADDPSPGSKPDRGKAMRLAGMEAVLSSHTADPANVARRVAQLLHAPFDRSALQELRRWPITESTESAQPETRDFGERSFARRHTAPGDAKLFPEKRIDREPDKPKMGNLSHSQAAGPFSIDLPGAISFGRGVFDKPNPPTVQAQESIYPEVNQTIQKIAHDALVPVEVRGTKRADNFADARNVAADLARKLDIAHRRGQEQIDLQLPEMYTQARDEETLIAAAKNIIRAIRDALPHHASAVKYVDIYFGPRLVGRGVAGPGQ